MESNSSISLLIKELNEGNEQAFEQIYKLLSPKVFAFALSLVNDRSDAEEILQEVFTKLWDKRFDLSPQGSLESYLFTSTRNILLNVLRKAEYHQGFVDYKLHVNEDEADLSHEMDYQELKSIYEYAIDKLSPRKREIYILNHKEALSCQEIAEKLGISVKSVRNQMDSASMEIRKHVRHRWVIGMLIVGFFIK